MPSAPEPHHELRHVLPAFSHYLLRSRRAKSSQSVKRRGSEAWSRLFFGQSRPHLPNLIEANQGRKPGRHVEHVEDSRVRAPSIHWSLPISAEVRWDPHPPRAGRAIRDQIWRRGTRILSLELRILSPSLSPRSLLCGSPEQPGRHVRGGGVACTQNLAETGSNSDTGETYSRESSHPPGCQCLTGEEKRTQSVLVRSARLDKT